MAGKRPSGDYNQSGIAAGGREMALDVADGEDEHAQQDDDLHRVIDEEVERAAPLARCVNA